jgi:hypothetical protein
LWGELVQLWTHNCHERPTTTDKLVNEMTAHGMTGASVYGNSPRPVLFYSYDDSDPLLILLPTPEAVAEGREAIRPLAPYHLPVFYDRAYSGNRKPLSAYDQQRFADCRIGEYTINNCG